MKISKKFKLGRSQFELDFVDIDPKRDKRLFVDPMLISISDDHWSRDVSDTIGSFFDYLIKLIRAGKHNQALELFKNLNEPNETCLGMSKGNPDGRGVGKSDSLKIFTQILSSKAVKSGLVKDIEDFVIFVDKFGPDKLSDMTTNIIRGHLVDYTKEQCALWKVPLKPNTPTGKIWDPAKMEWHEKYDEMLVVDGKRILLVPKSIVVRRGVFNADEYHRHDVLDFLKQEQLSIQGPLVRYRSKKGRQRGKAYVTKKILVEQGGAKFSKDFLSDFSLSHKNIFDTYKKRARKRAFPPPNSDLTDQHLAHICITLSEELKKTKRGNEQASSFHRLITGILEIAFYPQLFRPKIEAEIHEGRKRIDILFNNPAKTGFFASSPSKYGIPAPMIPIECKNYTNDPKNPELDQLATRLSPQRGQLGILVCRDVIDESLLIQRCADLWSDRHGLILPLWDSDLLQILDGIRNGSTEITNEILFAKAFSVAKKS